MHKRGTEWLIIFENVLLLHIEVWSLAPTHFTSAVSYSLTSYIMFFNVAGCTSPKIDWTFQNFILLHINLLVFFLFHNRTRHNYNQHLVLLIITQPTRYTLHAYIIHHSRTDNEPTKNPLLNDTTRTFRRSGSIKRLTSGASPRSGPVR
jgi:hypothetical protein